MDDLLDIPGFLRRAPVPAKPMREHLARIKFARPKSRGRKHHKSKALKNALYALGYSNRDVRALDYWTAVRIVYRRAYQKMKGESYMLTSHLITLREAGWEIVSFPSLQEAQGAFDKANEPKWLVSEEASLCDLSLEQLRELNNQYSAAPGVLESHEAAVAAVWAMLTQPPQPEEKETDMVKSSKKTVKAPKVARGARPAKAPKKPRTARQTRAPGKGNPVRVSSSIGKILALVLEGGNTLATIAKKLGIPQGNVAHRLKYVLKVKHGVVASANKDGVYTAVMPEGFTKATIFKTAKAGNEK